ncbi:GTP-binding protein ERG [Zostera marina]|uniref:GTP-binding protein ERG n=1 Tax=Zostera marina TaxID=29655 RepID=A0A0K9NRD9_ZOSMR|nr:GTP-binding protein ERG [Zostera marina]
MRRITLSIARLRISDSFPTLIDPHRVLFFPFISSHYCSARSQSQSQHLEEAPTSTATETTSRWNKTYRARVDEALFEGKEVKRKKKYKWNGEVEELKIERTRRLAKALLESALNEPDQSDDEVVGSMKIEDQKSLNVGIVGAPNAGKSSLTNYLVGTKVAGVSRKTNTTNQEVLGILTKGNTQICIFDTPGITIGIDGHPQKTDVKARVESAWKTIDLYDLVIVIFDVHRHLTMRPDPRVIRLIKYLGTQSHPTKKRILCMNKVDLVSDKRELLKVLEEFKDLPAYDSYFMISGLRGSGVKEVIEYIMKQAVERPWEEELDISEEKMKATSLEVVREKMLNRIHQEIPYVLEHRLMDWKELRDGSLRIEHHFIVQKQSQRQILIGKNGAMIGKIGMEANEELRAIFKREVHLYLQVRVAKKHGA